MVVVVNELLCYVQNNVAKHPPTLVGVAISGFYTDEEVSTAKQCLFNAVESLKLKGAPRYIKRQAGDNKRKLECEDILNMFSFTETAEQCVLPNFVAANLQRIPMVQPGDVDIYSIAANFTTITSQFEVLSKRFDESVAVIDKQQGQIDSVIKKLDALQSDKITGACILSESDFPPLNASTSSSWNSVITQGNLKHSAAMTNSAPVNRTEIAGLKAQLAGPQGTHRTRTRLYGTKKAASTEVKTIPRRIVAFAGRLHEDTTVDDLTEFLTESGLKDVKCTKLNPPAGRTFKTAAFCVSCPAEANEHLFYNENVWPDGAELRDWYFKEKPSKSSDEEVISTE